MNDLFSVPGLTAWRNHLDRSTAFKEAAANWNGSLLLAERQPATPERRIFVEIQDGLITASRLATAEDAEAAEFVLKAAPATWQALISGRRALAAAALAGELSLERGSIFRLLPHLRAATELLKAAAGND